MSMLDTDPASTAAESRTVRSGNRTTAAAERLTRLLGQPSLDAHLDFVRRFVVGGAAIGARELCDDWRAANDVYAELETDEAGLAQTVECRDLDPAMAPLATALEADPAFRQTFDCLPVTFGMVELDKLVVSQQSLTSSFALELAGRLGPNPDAAALFGFCQPVGGAAPPCSIEAGDDDNFVVSSPATHLTVHETLALPPEAVPGYASFGPIAGIFGVVVGFRGNFLNVIRADGRVVLNNGYHRAYALRSLGITHAPCVIEDVTRLDELRMRADDRVADDPAFYFRTRRPPLFKDFFDPRLSRTWPLRPRRKVIEVSFEIRKTYLVE
jgi:hypothetical protein